jgi:hypothetical protein
MFDIKEDRSARRRGLVPAGLAQMEPGPILAAFLLSVADEDLSGYDRVVVMQAHQRMASHYSARVYADMASVADALVGVDDDPEWAAAAASAEVRAALMLTRRSADAEVHFALELRERLPAVAEALTAGEIDVRRAKVMVNGTEHLADHSARAVIEAIIDGAPDLTTGQLTARLRKLCFEVDPDEAKDRYEVAVAQRRVEIRPTEDGTANFYGLELPPDRAAAASRHINSLARRLKTTSDPRTMDQLRADVFLDLLRGVSDEKPAGRRGMVDIHVDLATLVELSERPGELAGFGPVIADIARRIAAEQVDGQWRYTVTDPDTGDVVACNTTRRRPTAAQRRHVEANYQTCVFPGCRMPAVDCDLDHRIPWAQGGPTTVSHLAPGCRYDHGVRHHCDWTYQRLPNGDHRWTSPLGHTYLVKRRLPP